MVSKQMSNLSKLINVLLKAVQHETSEPQSFHYSITVEKSCKEHRTGRVATHGETIVCYDGCNSCKCNDGTFFVTRKICPGKSIFSVIISRLWSKVMIRIYTYFGLNLVGMILPS